MAGCLICWHPAPFFYAFDLNKTSFEHFYNILSTDKNIQLEKPSVSTDLGKTLFLSGRALREMYMENMGKKMSEFCNVKDGVEKGLSLVVTGIHQVLGRRAFRVIVEHVEGKSLLRDGTNVEELEGKACERKFDE